MKKMLYLAILFPALLAGQAQYVVAQRSVAMSAAPGPSIDTSLAEANLARRVTLRIGDVRLRQAIDTLSAVAGIDVAYRVDVLNQYGERVSVSANNRPVGSVLQKLLQGTNLIVSPLAEGHIAIVEAAAKEHETHAIPLSVTVTGHVSNTAGAPIPGVSVGIQAMGVGAQTDGEGRYAFTIPTERISGQTVTLVARVIGYTPKSIRITLTQGETVTEDFVLSINAMQLGEVVVTGAGTQTTREKLATTINTVDSSLIRRQTSPQNVVSALEGVAPGVEVRTPSGEPGASVSIKIRGVSTLSGTGQPLFVVDGQPIDNSTQIATTELFNGGVSAVNRAADINPADIESIDILKGSAASSIYGARASNGVVLITTKRGHAGQTRVSFTSTETADHALQNIGLQTKYGQGSNGARPPASCGVFGPTCSVGSWGPLLSAGTPVYNHQNELYQTGLTADNYLQISGGNERTTFFTSGGLTNQDGVFKGPHNKSNRATVRVKGSEQVMPSLNVSANFNYVDTRGYNLNRSDNPDGVLLDALRTPPDFNNLPYLDPANGLPRSYRMPNPDASTTSTPRGYDNPFFILNVPLATNEVGRSIGNVNADWNPLPWLSVKEALGADYYDDSRLYGIPLTSTIGSTGIVFQDNLNHLEIDQNLVATATGHFSDRFTNILTLGQNLNSRRDRDLFLTGSQLIAPQPFAIQNTVTLTGTNNQSLVHIAGYFVQDEVDLFNQLYVTGGVRDDGFSTFSSSKRSFLFPKFSVAWDVTRALGKTDQEGLISYAKLRFAYGETGKEPPVYALSNTLTNSAGFSGTISGDGNGTILGTQAGLVTGAFGNQNLRPEREREDEYGVDLGFFNQHADLSTTLYNKRSTDVIIPITTNAFSTGTTTLTTNAASISNKGLELSLNIRPYTSKNVAWTVGINYSKNVGNVLSLDGASIYEFTPAEGDAGGYGAAAVGYAPGVLIGTDFARCGRGLTISGVGNIDALCKAATPNYKPGALYLQANGQPVADPTNRVIADPNPKHLLSYNSTLKLWNKLTLSTLVDAHVGGQIYDATIGGLDRVGTSAQTLVRDQQGVFGKNYLTGPYPNVAGPGVGVVAFSTPTAWQNWFSVAGSNLGTGYQFVENSSFVKWRELSLTYNVDAPFMRHTGFSSMDVRIAGRNLHTWTKYQGTDPETSLEGGYNLTQGVDYFNMPQTRSLVFSISLNR